MGVVADVGAMEMDAGLNDVGVADVGADGG